MNIHYLDRTVNSEACAEQPAAEAEMRTTLAHPGWTVVQFTLPDQDGSAYERQCGWMQTG